MDSPTGTSTSRMIYERCRGAVDRVLREYGIGESLRSDRIVSLAQVQASLIRDDYHEAVAGGEKGTAVVERLAGEYAMTVSAVRMIVQGRR